MKRTKLSVLAAVITAAVLLTVMAISTGCSSMQTIDLKETIKVEFSGYNGYGTARIDDTDLYTAVSEALVKNKILSSGSDYEMFFAAESHPEIMDATNASGLCSLDKAEGLSNGDKVVLTFTYDNEQFKDIGLRFKGSSATLEVSGLEEIEAFDPFEGLRLGFDGYSGYGTAHIENKPSSGMEYTLSASNELKNGDIVKVTASIPSSYTLDRFAELYGGVPSAYSKEYTVSGLTEIETFDAFEGLTIKYEGYSPCAKAKIDNKPYGDLVYELDQRDNLKIGDVITVTITGAYEGWFSTGTVSDFIKNTGKAPAELSKEYVVSGLPEYITSFEQITEEVWDKIFKELADQKAARIDVVNISVSSPYFEGHHASCIPEGHIKNFKFFKAYLITPKSSSVKFMNRLMILYTCDFDSYNDGLIHVEGVKGLIGAFYIESLYRDADGVVLVPSTEIKFTNANKGEDWFLNDYISKYRADYVIEEMALDETP